MSSHYAMAPWLPAQEHPGTDDGLQTGVQSCWPGALSRQNSAVQGHEKLLTVRALELITSTENDRGMKPHNVCSRRCSYCPGYTESYFRQSVGGSTSLPAVAVTARTFKNVVSAFPTSFLPLMTSILTCDPPFVILNLRGCLMWQKPLTFAVHKVSL